MRETLCILMVIGLLAPCDQSSATPLSSGAMTIMEITRDNWQQAERVMAQAAISQDALVVVHRDVPQGPFPGPVPAHVRVLDLRYGDGINLVRGNHARLEGIWGQYAHLSTGLRQNLILSDVIRPDATVTDWRSQPKEYSPLEYTTPEEYAHRHNHYQNFLSEVWNFNPNINGVAIWGDSGAWVPGAKAWGAFFSARSWPLFWDKYEPENRPPFKVEDFDAQLVGIEVDVLNAGKPWLGWRPEHGQQWAKTGVQIVGFGKANTQAIEIRSEDSESPDWQNRKGVWHAAMVVYNSLDPKDGRVLFGLFEHAGVGIDFDRPLFSQGALRFRTEAKGQGLVMNNGKGGELYADRAEITTIAAGRGGFQILTAEGRTAFLVGPDGSISFGERHIDEALTSEIFGSLSWWPGRLLILLAIVLAIMLPLQILISLWIFRRMESRGKRATTALCKNGLPNNGVGMAAAV